MSLANVGAKIVDHILGPKETSTPAKAKTDPSRPMHAIAWHNKRDVRYVEVPRPMLTDTTDIVLKVTATTICGSDLHLYSGSMLNVHTDEILGHEFMGIIEEVGSDVKKLKAGQRVVVAFDIACGKCEYCQREEYTGCDTTNPSKLQEYMYGHRTPALFGYSHLTGGVAGGQAEYVRVPWADVNCIVVPDELPDEKVLYLSDAVPTAYHGVVMGEVDSTKTVGIWGLGPIGLYAARWCQIVGAKRVIGIDWVPERLELAKKLGIEVINYKEQDVYKTSQEMVPGGYDVAIECVGFEYAKTWKHKVEMALNLETDTADIFTEMIYLTRKFGIISVLGVYSGFCNHFPVGAMMEKGLTVRGSQSPTQKYWNFCLEKIRSGDFDPTFAISHKGRLSDAPELYQKFYDRQGVIKVFLRPDNLIQTK